MDNSTPGSTEYGQSRQRKATGDSKIVVVDLGDVHSEARVSSLRRGQGELINQIERIVDDLVDAGTLKSGAQTVVVVVRESAPFPFSFFAKEDEEEPDD
jgi:hypothetical protein